MRKLSALAPLFLSGLLCAQYVSPSYQANAEGASSNVFPFGNATVPFRYAQIHDDVPVMPISSLSFRHAGGTATSAASTITCDIWLSTALTTSTTVSSIFDNNHGGDKTQVVTAGVFNHPASTSRFVPQPFTLKYPCAMFVFPGGGSLCWETKVTAKSASLSAAHDAIGGLNANPPLQVGRGGTGCLATGRTVVFTASGASTMSWSTNSGTLTVTGTNAPASAPAFHTIGVDPNNWASLPLPFELPGTGTAPSGSCFIYNDLTAVLNVTATAAGGITSAVPIPAFPFYNGVTIYSQLWALDATANGFGLVTTHGVAHNFLAPTPIPPLVRVSASGSLGATGTIFANSGLVTKFN